jgi:uncharacterized protein (DUF849 family)
MRQGKLFINCAVTGSIHIPTMSEYLPITPQQIADEGVKAANAGAATVHLHARDPKTGQPSSDLGLFREICREISGRSNVIQCPTTGGGLGMTPEERVRVVAALEPELASCNMGSFNFGLFPLLERYSKYKFDWEPKYLEMTRDFIFANTSRPFGITGRSRRWNVTIWATFTTPPTWRTGGFWKNPFFSN